MTDLRHDDESAEREPATAEGRVLTPEEQAQLEEQQAAAERGYFRVTRGVSASLLAVLPLLAIYEFGVLLTKPGDINAAAYWVKSPISWMKHPAEVLGTDPTLILNGLLIVAALIAVWRLGKLRALHSGTFVGMFLESVLYAMLLGPLALAPLTGRIEFGGFALHLGDLPEKLIIASGAGLYEELVFRVMILGAVYVLARELCHLKPAGAAAWALVISSALFSAAHFLSPGESVQWTAFAYRSLCGIVLGLIFILRGFGIAAWTHAIYDIYVLCFVAQ